jgi:hypothetical protein
MRTSVSLELADEVERLNLEVELDGRRRVVTLHMLEFDALPVTSFLVQTLPQEFGIRVDDAVSERWLSLPRYDVVIELAGRRHPVRMHHLNDGRTTIRLGDPDAAYLARCHRAIEHLLASLHQLDVEAVITGIDHYGRPAPNEGFLQLYARARDAVQEQAIAQVRSEVEAKLDVSICVVSDMASTSSIDHVFAHEAHFGWDGQQLVRRNWPSATRAVGKDHDRRTDDWNRLARAPSPKRSNMRWLRADELDPLQREAWKQTRQVFSVVNEGV